MFRSVIPLPSDQKKFNRLLLAGLLLCALAPPFPAAAASEKGPSRKPSPTQIYGSGTKGISFVKNEKCGKCHSKQLNEWRGSHHERAMETANAKTVLGDFNNARFTHFGVTSRFFKKGNQFFVHTEGPKGKMADFEIKYTFGVEPLQQYLVEFPGGRLQALTIAWDTGKKRWFHLFPNEKITSDDPLHWTRRLHNWNARCADCHSTNLRRNYDLKTDAYRTTWAEINVSCQSCHGPGERHLQWAEKSEKGKEGKYENKGLVVEFKGTSSNLQVETCAPCHSRRHHVSPQNGHGEPFLDHFMPALLRADLYHPDGQVLDEVYVYGSFIQSKMYHAGVRCSDCHNPHNLTLKAQGNALCAQCHQEQKVKRFETLKPKNYDSKAHHFHPADSPGAKCVNCHMPGKNFMVIDYRRDHSFRIPRPDLSEKLGTPNACISCHKDKTNQWAADATARWYGTERGKVPHDGEVIKRGRSGQPGADRPLAQLAQDTAKPAIIRATAVDLLRRYGRAGLPAIVAGLKDKSPLVRAEAVGGLYRIPSRHKLRLISPLLQDPVRAVRVEAGRVMATVPDQEMSPEIRTAFRKSIAEYQSLQMSLLDTPEAHLNLGVMNSDMGKTDLAESSYKTAIRLDSLFLPARVNLANLYNRLKRNKEAEKEFRQAIQISPKNGELNYSLGLLLAEEKKFDEAARFLGKAARLDPYRLRFHYNHGLTLQRLGRRKEAEAAFRNAFWLNQKDPRTLQALAIFYMQGRRWEQAKGYAERLVRLFPNAPGPRRMLGQIQSQMKK